MQSATLQTTDTSAHALIPAGNTGVSSNIADLIITNESATATVISLSDGTKTYKFAIGASGGMVANFAGRLPESSPATAWTVQSSAAATLDFVVTYELRERSTN